MLNTDNLMKEKHISRMSLDLDRLSTDSFTEISKSRAFNFVLKENARIGYCQW